MIRVCRASRSLLRSCPELAPGPDRVFVSAPDQPLPWGALRVLLGALEARVGVERVLALADPGPLSLCLSGLEPGLDAEGRARRERAAAALDGFMTHNPMVFGDLQNAWHALLVPLLREAGLAVVVPDALWLSTMELEVLVGAARASGTPLWLGDPEDTERLEPLWQRSVDDTILSLLLLQANPDVSLVTVGDSSDALPTQPAALSQLDPAPELRAWALLDAPADAPQDLEGARVVLEAVRGCFRCFGFTVALRLALALLEREPPLPSEELGELHALAALSAYNRQVRGEGNLELAALLERHLLAARALLPSPAWQSHLLYRLVINTGRRKGALGDADTFAEESLAAAADPTLPPGQAGWLRAWALNGRAYLHIRRRALDAAINDELDALALLDQAQGPGVPANEVEPTRAVLYDNLTRMTLEGGRLDEARRWHALLEEADRRVLGEVGPVPRMKAIAIARRERRLREALDQARAGLAAATARLSALYADLFAMEVGDLCYRLGDAAGAREAFGQALRLRERVADDPDVFQARLGLALSAWRAGDRGAAEEQLLGLLQHPAAERETVRARLLAWLGVLAAELGDGSTADARINAGIELAVSTGDGDTLLEMALLAGRACLALERQEEAAEAYAQALALLETGDGLLAPAPLRLRAWLGIARTRADALALAEALRILPEALEDAEIWWALPLLKSMLDLLQPTLPPEDEALRAGLSALTAGLLSAG